MKAANKQRGKFAIKATSHKSKSSTATATWTSNFCRKIVAAGRGRVIQSPPVKAEIMRLARCKNPHVVYLGTATYEASKSYDLQAAGFEKSGCTVEKVNLTDIKAARANIKQIKESILRADIIAVSGGNTLFAMKRWRELKLSKTIEAAMHAGTVLCGGSAGAICWFDGGHSDSRDPTSLRHVDPNLTDAQKKDWSYIRVSGLGFVKGLGCPHHDSTQSNGVPRSEDFDGMMQRHSSETGVCIDDQAALIIDGDMFHVVASEVAGSSERVTKKIVNDDGSISATVFRPSTGIRPLSELLDA